MIDDKSDAGAWAKAIAHSPCLRASEYEPAPAKGKCFLYDGTALEGGIGLPVRPMAATVVAEP